jgi:hypothetical protein
MTDHTTDMLVHPAPEIGLEEIEPGHWIAWVLAIPGCYANGITEHEALAGVPDAWRAETGHDMPGPLRVVERWRGVSAVDDPGFIVNATFADDLRPLDAEEIDAGIARLERNHRRFLDVLGRVPVSDEIGGIIRHLTTAEQWYLGNIDLVPEGKGPDDPLERFAWIRAFTLRALPTLAGRDILADCAGEGWTPRKVLRRMIWHERDHTRQIATILAASA